MVINMVGVVLVIDVVDVEDVVDDDKLEVDVEIDGTFFCPGGRTPSVTVGINSAEDEVDGKPVAVNKSEILRVGAVDIGVGKLVDCPEVGVMDVMGVGAGSRIRVEENMSDVVDFDEVREM
jgi:hypothetical protein